jgi:hypothetical protein
MAFGLGSIIGGTNAAPAAPAAKPAASDPSQSMNPLTRMKAKAQGNPNSKKVSDVDLGSMGQPVTPVPMM